jgi:hypothetical protein
LPAFGHLSPHPTIYQAIEEEAMEVAGEKYYFGIDDQIVFEPWLVRISHPGIRGPLRIGRLDITTNYHLCCETFPQLEGLYERDILAWNEAQSEGELMGRGLTRICADPL